MRLFTLVAIPLAIALQCSAQAQSPPTHGSAICATEGNIQLLCQVKRPEDLLQVPGTNWVVTSSLDGGLYLIDARDKTIARLFPSATAKYHLDKTTYDTCPGPLDETAKANFVTAGIAIRPAKNGTNTLYAVHFGKESSVQVFELDTRAKTPSVTWVGCVVASATITLNSIGPLPEGGFIASNFLPRAPGSEALRARVMAGEVNGEVWEWHTGKDWVKVPGSEASGANGVAVSEDGRWLYVSQWGSQSILRLSRGSSPPKRDEIRLDFRPDNLHWAPDGMLLAAGPTDSARTKVVKIDPNSLKVTQLLDKPDTQAFERGTAAMQVGDEIWVGSARGDRIAIFPAPK